MLDITFDTLCADFEDICPTQLHGDISIILKAKYLGPVTVSQSLKKVNGCVLGSSLRPIISLHVQISYPILTLTGSSYPVNVHFLYLAASPQTYMSREALRAIGIEDMVVVGESMGDPEPTKLPLLINGFRTLVLMSPSKSHFAHLNILGEDFIQASEASVFFGGPQLRFEITFP